MNTIHMLGTIHSLYLEGVGQPRHISYRVQPRRLIRCEGLGTPEYVGPNARNEFRERQYRYIEQRRRRRFIEEEEWERIVDNEERHGRQFAGELLSARQAPRSYLPQPVAENLQNRNFSPYQENGNSNNGGKVDSPMPNRLVRKPANDEDIRSRWRGGPPEIVNGKQPKNHAPFLDMKDIEDRLLKPDAATAFTQGQLQRKASQFRTLVHALQDKHSTLEPYRSRRDSKPRIAVDRTRLQLAEDLDQKQVYNRLDSINMERNLPLDKLQLKKRLSVPSGVSRNAEHTKVFPSAGEAFGRASQWGKRQDLTRNKQPYRKTVE